MRNSKLIALLLCFVLAFSLSACNKHGHTNQHQSSDNGSDGNEDKIVYVYSVVSKTVHLSDCYHVDRMNEEYKNYFEGDVNSLVAKGYTLCRDCIDIQVKEEEPEEEDDTNKIPKEEATYVINSSSKTFHELDCHHINVMSDKNIQYTDLSLEELVAEEIRPCSSCLPDAAKEWKENHPEEDAKEDK